MIDARQYVLISPCRNEEEYARRTLDSVLAQSVRPALWVIVDDGSSDKTPDILREYESKHNFIRVIHREDRGTRSVGPGVIDAFYAGLESVNLSDFTYLCKLDLDLELPPRYFEILIEQMESEPRLGTCSGKPYVHTSNGTLVPEPCGDEMSVGMTKFYRMSCFQEIGGFVREVMWDGIDCHRCRMMGWIARSWDEPDLRFEHLRPMGSSQRGLITGRIRHGYGQYYMGTSLPYITASAIYRATKYPFLVGGAAIWWGYVRSWLRRLPRYSDRAFRQFLRQYQLRCLLTGKQHTTDLIHDTIRSRTSYSSEKHASQIPTVDLCGIQVANISEWGCISYVLSELRAERGGWIVTANLDILRRLVKEQQFRNETNEASFIVPDGMPLVMASVLSGTPLKQRVSGSDLITSLSAEASADGYSVFLLGGDEGTADSAASVLKRKFPSLTIAGTYCPPFGFEHDPDAIQKIIDSLTKASPNIIYVALGSPKQEKLIRQIKHHLPNVWWIGVGISFSFLSGDRKRAPIYMQRLGLEWLHRLIHEPKRLFRRYIIQGIPFAIQLFASSIVRRYWGRIPQSGHNHSQQPSSLSGSGVSQT